MKREGSTSNTPGPETGIQVNIEKYDGSKPIEVVIRKGDASEIKDLQRDFSENVLLSTLLPFLEKTAWARTPKAETAVVLFSKDPKSPFVIFQEDPTKDETYTLTSRLVKNSDLGAWGINNDVKFSQKSLEKHVLKYAFMFSDQAEAKTWLTQLRNFAAKMTTEVKKNDDREGNKKESFETLLSWTSGELPKQLELTAPLFNGTKKEKITLSIEVDEQNGQPAFSFWALDLTTLYETKTEQYINEVVDVLKQKYVTLEQ